MTIFEVGGINPGMQGLFSIFLKSFNVIHAVNNLKKNHTITSMDTEK